MARILGTTLNDDFLANPAGALIYGLGGRDILSGNIGDDTFFGGTGDDVLLDNRGGADRFSGGAGRDLIDVSRYYTMPGGPLFVDGGAGDDTIRIYNYTANSELPLHADVHIVGGSGNDQVFASGIAGLIDGGSGDDFISSQYSAATILGGAGSDFISFSGQDGENGVIDGGTGNDTVHATTENTDLTIKGGDGHDDVILSIQRGTHQGLVDLGAGDDSVIAYGLTEDVFISLLCGAGNDIMFASGFVVEARGGSGNDMIYVEATDAIVDAGSGLDTVTIGAEGNYAVLLGGGPDRLQVAALFSTRSETGDVIRVADFRVGNSGDVLDLSGALAGVGWTSHLGDPFDTGFARLRASSPGTSTFVEVARGDGDWMIQAMLIGITPESLNAHNLDGFTA